MKIPIPAGPQVAELFREHRPLVLRFFLTSIGRAALALGAILLIQEFLQGVLGEGEGGLASWVADRFGADAALWTVAVALAVAYIGSSLFNYDNRVVQQRIVKVLELGLMERLLRHLLGLSVPFFDRQSHGDIIQAVRQDVSELRSTILAMAGMTLEATLAVGLTVAAVSISPFLAFWGLLVLPLTLVPILLIARRTLHHAFEVRKTGYVLFDVILQLLRGIRIIKTYKGEEAEARAAVQKARLYFDELIEMVRVRWLANVALESIASLGIVLVVVLGGFQVMRGTLEWPAFVAFLMALRALHGPLNNFNTFYVEIKRYGAAVDRIQSLLDERPDVPEAEDAVPLEGIPDVIRFEDVGFSYGDTRVLDGVSFEVRAGETLGIAGPSGVGKSTLLGLVARFYDPTEGRVVFGDQDLRSVRLADVYENLAIVSQTPFLFDATIRENIRAGRPEASDASVQDAARVAGVHAEILELPDGYETTVGVGGHGLSVGQAQRINIARAVLKGAPILLLDEATSSLDSLAEAQVQAGIDRLVVGRTTFIVAHRLSTLGAADRILVLRGGRVEGLAPHEELLATCPFFREMWETQRLQGGERGSQRGRSPPDDASSGDSRPPDYLPEDERIEAGD